MIILLLQGLCWAINILLPSSRANFGPNDGAVVYNKIILFKEKRFMRNKVVVLVLCALSVLQKVHGSEIVQQTNPFELNIDYTSYKKNLDTNFNGFPEWVKDQFGNFIRYRAEDSRKEFAKDMRLIKDQITRIELGVVKKLNLIVPSDVSDDYDFLKHLFLFFNTPSISDITFNGHTHLSRNALHIITSSLQKNNNLITLRMSELCACLDDQSKFDLLEGLNINKSIKFFNGEEKTIGITKLENMDCKGAICSYPQSFVLFEQTTNAEELDSKIVLDYNMLLKSPDHFPVPNCLLGRVDPSEVQEYITKAREDVHYSVESFQLCRNEIFSGSKRNVRLSANSNIMKMDFFLRDLNDLLCKNVVKELSFKDTPTLSIEAIGIISNALKSTQSLKVLDLSGAFLETHPNDIKMLIHSLKENRSITKLDMSDQRVVVRESLSGLKEKTHDIFLAIMDMLVINQTIETLNLSQSYRHSVGIPKNFPIKFAIALSKNKSLKYLNLKGSFFCSSELEAILKYLIDVRMMIHTDFNKLANSSLNYVSFVRETPKDSYHLVIKEGEFI